MSDIQITEQTEERKAPTLADIVREKTDDGKRIIDFFLDVMEDRIDGAELCHRIDAAKQLEKHKSKAAAKFLAEYRGVSCGHSINGRPDPADPCSAADRSLVAVTLNAPPTLTQEFLTVLSGIDEFLMTRLIRAQTADAGTIIDFLDDVMQDRTDGFKTHHRLAAAKELIVHIVRDEQPSHTPSPSTGEGWGESDPPPLPQGEGWGEGDSTVVPAQAGTQGGGGGAAANSAHTEPVLSTVEGSELVAGSVHTEPSSTVVPAQSLPRTRYGAGTQGRGGARSTAANPARTEPVPSTAEGSAHPEPNSPVVPAPTAVVPAKAGTHPRDPDPGSQLETKNSPSTTHPNTKTPGRSRQGRHSQKGPGVRAHRGGKGRKIRPRKAHHRRAQNQGKTRTALARAGPLWRTHRLHTPRPLASLVGLPTPN